MRGLRETAQCGQSTGSPPYSQVPIPCTQRPPFSEAERRVAIELWKAGISLKKIRDPLKMSERCLRNIFAYAKAHPEAPIPKKSKIAGRPSKIFLGAIREMKRRLMRNPCITARKLKKDIPQLENVSVRSIQMFCKDQLSCPAARWRTSPSSLRG
jgi:hypothetical protein